MVSYVSIKVIMMGYVFLFSYSYLNVTVLREENSPHIFIFSSNTCGNWKNSKDLSMVINFLIKLSKIYEN